MSHRVLPMIVLNPDDVLLRTLHYVPAGQMECAVCGLHKLRMGFYYTDEPQYWNHVQQHVEPDEVVGLWSPAHEMAMPFWPCGRPTPSVSPKLESANDGHVH